MTIETLKDELRKARDRLAQAELEEATAQNAARQAWRAYSDAVMLETYGIKRGDVIWFKKKQGFGDHRREVTRRMQVVEFGAAWSDSPSDWWVVGVVGKQGGTRLTLYNGLGNVEWGKMEVQT